MPVVCVLICGAVGTLLAAGLPAAKAGVITSTTTDSQVWATVHPDLLTGSPLRIRWAEEPHQHVLDAGKVVAVEHVDGVALDVGEVNGADLVNEQQRRLPFQFDLRPEYRRLGAGRGWNDGGDRPGLRGF